MIYDSLQDILKHTSGIGLEVVKLVYDEEDVSTKVEAMDEDRTVVLFGTMNDPIEDLDRTVGLGRLGILGGYLNFMGVNDGTVSIIKEERRGEEMPTEIFFKSGRGHTANYRFMSKEQIDEKVNIPPFKGASWDVTIIPEKEGVRDLNAMNSILGSVESNFIAKTNNGKLEFHIGGGGSDRSVITFAETDGVLKHGWVYPIQHVLTILKLQATSKKFSMSFSNLGALKIEVESGLGKYTYILPARQG